MKADSETLAQVIGVTLSPELLSLALTHRSFAYENGGIATNERLEFLGDSVLGLVVTDSLYRDYPELPEGQLAKMRASIVNSKSLAEVARAIGLGEHIRLGRGELGTGGADKSSILADTLEAVIGAVYLDGGLDEARALLHRLFDPVIKRAAGLGAGLDWKTSLQELSAACGLGVPEYVVTDSGPDHSKRFAALVRLGDAEYPPRPGGSKKEAEQRAAEAAWKEIDRARGGHAAGTDARTS
ncbi:MAG: ribonuclease III [Candidatus Nanopelagicales bacterium]